MPIQNLKYADVPLSGRLRTAIDGTELEEGDFQVLKNMRYGEITPKSVTGMTQINTAVPINATYIKPRAGFHFRKAQPAESHVLVQTWDTTVQTTSTKKVYENTTAIPSAGTFTTAAVWDDTASASTGQFSNAPDGCVTYANGKDSCVWGGSEYRCAGFILKSTAVAAQVVLTGTDTPHNTNTVTLDTKTYTFVDTVGTTEGNVHIGDNLASALDNLKSAVTHTGTAGTDYYCAAAHTTVTATTNTDTTQLFIALTAGTSGNAIASTETTEHSTFGSETLAGGLDEGAGYLYDYTEQVTNTLSDPLNIAILNQSPSYVYVASTRPIKGVKFYVKTPNTATATVGVKYWASSAWTSVTGFDDQTDYVTGKTLSLLTGTGGWINFDTTVGLAKPKLINRVYAYWYQFTFTDIIATTSVYYVTVDAPFQAIVDLWDGEPRSEASYIKDTTSGYVDESTTVLEEDYVSGDILSYSSIGGLTTAERLFVGFPERMTGIDITLVTGKVNTNASVLTIKYWNGSAWTSVGTIEDGTKTTVTTLNKSGSVIWDAPVQSSEFKAAVSNSDLWYYYEIAVDATLSGTVYIDKITGIPAQRNIKGYSYPVMWQNRVWLLDNTAEKRNSALCSAQDTVCVFNGSDSTTLYFGNEERLVCGGTLFTRFGSNIYDNLILVKKNEVWLLDGTTPEDYRQYKVGDNSGCIAPKTFIACDMGYEIAPGINKHVLIWQSENALVMFDGNVISPISTDIENYFDRTKTECIPDAMKDDSTAFYDESRFEYHWCFASESTATTLNKEFVYSLLKRKWFEIDRGTGKYLQIGFSVQDTNGNNFTYGGIETGYIERLEYGTTFDGNNIVSQFRTLDIPFGGYDIETEIRHIRLVAVAKSTTTNTVTATHYGDGITTSALTTATFIVKDTTHRFVKPTKSVKWGSFLFHSISCSLTTSDENCGFEPIGLGIMWELVREGIL